MKKTIRIHFEDFWGYDQYVFNPTDNYFLDLMSLKYDVVLDRNNPDILFFSGYNTNNHVHYNCKKVLVCTENYGVNFKSPFNTKCDASLSQFIDSNTNYYFPLWVIFINWFNKQQPRPLPSNPTYCVPLESLTTPKTIDNNRKFCCFINNNPIPDRIECFNLLSSYKTVDSYGYLYNNVGKALRGSEEAKCNVLKNYKFTIAFENTQTYGYNTEKIIQPLATGCIPIYSGGAKLRDYFNKGSFIYAHDFSSISELVEYVKVVDQNKELYEKYINTPPFINNEVPSRFKPENVLDWLCNTLKI